MSDDELEIHIAESQPQPRTDVDRLLDMFSALDMGQSDTMHMITIPGAPWSKARPRFNRKGFAYTHPDDIDAEHRTAIYLRQSVRQPYTGNVGVACLFYRPNHQRIDCDNLLKHVCDAANGVLWKDDSQCTALMGFIELDATNPRTVIIVGEHQSTLCRGTNDTHTCQVCGKQFMRTTRMRDRPNKTCSRSCSAILRGFYSLAEPIPCASCGQKFKRRTKTQRFCSEECRRQSLRDKAKSSGRPYSKCTECGAQLAHKRGGRCRSCWCRSPRGPLKPEASA